MTDTIEKAPTQDIVKANIQLELTKSGLIYQFVLQGLENIKFTRDNIEEMRLKLAPGEKLVKQLNDRVNPYKEAWQNDNAAKKSLLTPVEEVLSRKKSELAKIAKEIADENAKIEAEKQKAAAEELAANNFFLSISQQVASAETDFEIVRIEKLIGAHSAKPLYKEKAETLKPIISKQKEHIRKLDALKEQEKKAEQSGDDEKVMQLREQQEAVEAKKSETTEAVQMAAIKTAETPSAIFPEVVGQTTVKAARTYIKWEVTDINELYKKIPELVTLIPNKEAIDLLLSQHREKLAEKKEKFIEVNSNGLRFYEDKKW
jgi:ribosomal protein S19